MKSIENSETKISLSKSKENFKIKISHAALFPLNILSYAHIL